VDLVETLPSLPAGPRVIAGAGCFLMPVALMLPTQLRPSDCD